MKIKSYAKINLALDVLGREPNGFHRIQTVFCEYKDLYDEISIYQVDGEGISVDCKGDTSFDFDHTNSCYRAARSLQKAANIKEGVHIILDKNIPVGAGLGGASSNAAAILKALNEIWNLKYTLEDLAKLGAEIGCDVPFSIYGGFAIGEHYGEKVTPISSKLQLPIKILFPGVSSFTDEAYRALDLAKCGLNKGKTDKLITALKTNNQEGVIENIHNDFETLLKKEGKIFKRHRLPFAAKTNALYKQMYKNGAKKVCLSGSGSAVFGVF